MKIRNKILLYFSTTVISLTVISSVIIYLLFSESREEEFQQRQKEKIKYTIGLIAEYKELSENLSAIMDKHTIHDFYDEKMLIFDKHKNLVYKSVDDLPINNYEQILNDLSPSKQWIETKQDKYDIVGIYIENENNHFYAISKAFDEFGYSKLDFLRNTLLAISVIISLIVLVIAYYLSARISKPITLLAEKLNSYDISNSNAGELDVKTSSFELNYLTEKFNQLIKRTNEAFSFQKHAIQHISHELKTPVTILVSELEKARMTDETERKNNLIESQIIKAKSLGEIINVLLEIAKIESGQPIQKQLVRIDEVLFDLIEELNSIYPDFYFEVNYIPDKISEGNLILNVNKMLIRQAFQNLLTNCITYSNNPKAQINIDCSANNVLKVKFFNSGKPVSQSEEKYLFNHFFRGENSQGKSGFGLGLVLTQKIIAIHSGTITYSNPAENLNVFELSFPLS
ncbi:MAG: HAMP domain-containing sensor histidine kinase [Algoriphagus sp.]|uniref:sensor histidine kinase n=1 Tax=Algoriphagus sp. TaxID=1872435 RepID=UPI00273489BD|nr:HAMP domain-containing sensor histidine kinase [Algoriphagus sp.]MDP3200396.1 HAMP domain-containing sensor histidine kinase [Algoriphagus sp.]